MRAWSLVLQHLHLHHRRRWLESKTKRRCLRPDEMQAVAAAILLAHQQMGWLARLWSWGSHPLVCDLQPV